MKLLIGLFLSILIASSAFGQTVVSGSVANKAGEALVGSTILFIQADTVAGGTVTDGKGRFELKGLPKGEYVCQVSMLGYKTASQKFQLVEKVKLPKFELEEDATILSEVTVRGDARKMTKERAGMSIYYLTEQAKNESNAYLAMREIPRLNVDEVNRSVTLIDGTVPLILIDGVRKPLDVINPEFIESVEVIENPSARYRGDSQVAAVLNIKLKKEGIKPYLRGEIGVVAQPNANFIFSNGSLEIGNANSSMYLNAQYWRIRKNIFKTFHDEYQGNIHRSLSGENKSLGANNQTINFGGDKLLSKRSYFAYSIKYHAEPNNNHATSTGEITDLTEGQTSPLISVFNSDIRNRQLSADLYYKHSFTDNRSLELTGDYYYSLNGNTADRTETSDLLTFDRRIDLDNTRHMGKLDVDFSDMLTESIHLVAGSNTEYSVTNIDDRLDQWPNFRYRRAREYLYAGIDNNRSDARFNYMVSLGLDMIFSDATGIKNSYVDFAPAVSIAYQLSRKHSVNLSYNRSRQMPSAGNLNPRNTSTDILIVYEGNPLLRPSHTDYVKLGYVFRSGNVWLNPYVEYKYFSDEVMPYQYMEGDVVINTYQNFGYWNKLQAGTSFNYNIPHKNNFYGYVNAGLYYEKNYIKGMAFRGSTLTAMLKSTLNYRKVYFYVDLRYSTAAYSLYAKYGDYIFSSCNFGWNISNSINVRLSAQSYICPRRSNKVWYKSDTYSYYDTSVRLTQSPMFQIGIWYNFKTKNFKWRNKKQFNGSDNELQTIKTN